MAYSVTFNLTLPRPSYLLAWLREGLGGGFSSPPLHTSRPADTSSNILSLIYSPPLRCTYELDSNTLSLISSPPLRCTDKLDLNTLSLISSPFLCAQTSLMRTLSPWLSKNLSATKNLSAIGKTSFAETSYTLQKTVKYCHRKNVTC